MAITKALAAEGARVIVNGRSEARVKEAIASIRANVPTAKLEGLALDLSEADAAAQTTKRHPDVDILVNNLGVYEVKDFEQITDAEWLTITRAPSAASALAMAKPIPAVEPLTRASLFSSWRFICFMAWQPTTLASELILRSLSCGKELCFWNVLFLDQCAAQLR